MRSAIGSTFLCVAVLSVALPCGAMEWALTTGTDTYDDPDWCDKYIAVYSDHDQSVDNDIWIVEVYPDGSFKETYRVTQSPTADDRAPTWEVGQCGFGFYFQRDDGSTPTSIRGGNTMTPGITFPITLGTYNYYAPDRSSGEMLVYSDRSGNNDIVAIDHGGEAQGWRYITTNAADDVDPCWSPDGQWVAFASDRSGNYDIWVASVSGEGDSLRQVTNTPEDERLPDWSPTGEFIAFARDGSGIVATDAWGRVEYQVTEDGTDSSPTWSDDGTMLAFSRSSGGGRNIWVTDNVPESPVETSTWGRLKARYR